MQNSTPETRGGSASHLKQLRQAFGWSQEKLAEVIGKDVATISRWERGVTKEPLTGTIIEAVARNVVSGKSTRLGAYAEAVIPAGLKFAVDEHPGLRFLFLEEDLVMIRASRFAVKAFPLMDTVMGVTFTQFCKPEYIEQQAYIRSLPREGLIAVKSYVEYDASILKWHPICFREYLISNPIPHILDVSGRDISREEYEARPADVIPVYA